MPAVYTQKSENESEFKLLQMPLVILVHVAYTNLTLSSIHTHLTH